MSESAAGYAVYLFEQAVEALGEAIRPYLKTGASGAHVCCHAVDTALDERVRREGTIDTSSRSYARRAVRPIPISTRSGTRASNHARPRAPDYRVV